jgi:hypothetical protein
LPPDLAGGIWSSIALALAERYAILAKSYINCPILSLQLKQEAIEALIMEQAE